ncbi:hypothetical protein EBZ80_21160 [bacterium]|nr:hypothetical protein [bacterium]
MGLKTTKNNMTTTVTRTFGIVDAFTGSGHVKSDLHNFRGTYTGEPLAAAKKAAAFLCRHSAIHGQCTVYVTIREKTRGSAHKHFCYKVKRVKLPKPTVTVHNGVEVHHHYKTVIKSVGDADKNARTWPDPRKTIATVPKKAATGGKKKK